MKCPTSKRAPPAPRELVKRARCSSAKSRLEPTRPLVSAARGSAFLLALVRSFVDRTVALFISGGLTTTLPKQMWTESLTQFTPALTAVSVLFLAFVSTLILAGEGILKARR